MITLVQLRHFITLARAGSFVRASALLYVTQPALSRSIKALEEDLGQLLFDRVGRRIELTAFGRDTLVRAQQLIDDADQIRGSGRRLEDLPAGRLRLGLSSGPGVMLTVALITHFAQHYPQLHVDIVRANTQALTQMLRDRQVDALVVDARSLRPAPDLRIEQLSEMKGAFLCRPGHPLLQSKRIMIEQILRYPVASTPLSDELARILVERYGTQAHPDAMVRLTSDEISHLAEVARASDAILLAIRASAPDLVELPVSPALDASARFGLVTLVGRTEGLFMPEVRRLMAAALRESPDRPGTAAASTQSRQRARSPAPAGRRARKA